MVLSVQHWKAFSVSLWSGVIAKDKATVTRRLFPLGEAVISDVAFKSFPLPFIIVRLTARQLVVNFLALSY